MKKNSNSFSPPELIWPGKYREDGTRFEYNVDTTPFLCTEHFGVEVEGNRLYWGDNLKVMELLVQEQAGSFDLIYLDPPFATGHDFSVTIAMGEQGVRPKGAPTWCETIAYEDRWEESSFCQMMMARLQRIHALLAPTGSLFLHCDHRTDWALRAILEEVFGAGRVINQMVWHYTGGGRSKRRFSRKYDTIFWATKSSDWTFHIDEVRVPYKPTSGYAKGGIVSASGKRYMPHPDGSPVDDVWEIPIVNPMSHERWEYPTQKPESLLERIVRAASNPGDLVADFFCGSGTTLAVAQKLGRRWVGCDQGHWAIHTTRKRLLSLEPPPTFSILRAPHDIKQQGQLSSVGTLLVSSKLWDNGRVQVELSDLNRKSASPLPESVLECMTHWSDLFDSWAVDAQFSGDTFRPQWLAHRTRSDRRLPLCSEPVEVSDDGVICIRAVDIFGRVLQQVVEVP